MFKILEKEMLNAVVARIVIDAPLIARKAEAGQFIILRATDKSERMPLTISAYDRERGTIALIFQIVGAGTAELNSLKQGDSLQDCVGPLGEPTRTEGLKKVCVVGGGVGLRDRASRRA